MSRPVPGALLLGRFYSERNREYPLNRTRTSLGRARGNTIVIQDEQIAAHHACLWRDGESYVVEAISDEAPTFVNGDALRGGGRRPLNDADLLRLAALEFEFRLEPLPSREAPRLWVSGGVHGGKVFRLPGSRAVIGRAPENDVQFPDRTVSRRHCAIAWDGLGWTVEDLASTNGTLVNWTPIAGPTSLYDGDELTIGYSRFVFRCGAVAAALRRSREEAEAR